MEGAIFDCPASWEPWLPPQVRRLTDVGELTGREWGVLALTAAGCAKLTGQEIRCELLLLPGDCPLRRLDGVRPRHAVSYGLSPRDSLTLSSVRPADAAHAGRGGGGAPGDPPSRPARPGGAAAAPAGTAAAGPGGAHSARERGRGRAVPGGAGTVSAEKTRKKRGTVLTNPTKWI